MTTTKRRWRTGREFAVALAVGAVAFGLSARFDLFEHWQRYSREHEAWDLDELPVASVTALVVLMYFWWARSRREAARAKELGESSRHYRSLFDNHPSSVFSLNRDGVYVAANPASVKLAGYTLDELQRFTFADVVVPEDLPRAAAAFASVLEGTAQQIELGVVHKDGHLVDVELVALPIRDAPGEEVSGVYGIAQDVTERNRLHRAVADALAVAEQSSAAKSQFLATVSHEIRTPLASVIGATEMLLDEQHSPTTDRLLRTIDRSARRLWSLVNDILDLSRIEAGKTRLENRPFSPAQVLTEVATLSNAKALQKDLAITTRVDDSTPRVCYGDPHRVAQVLTNLVDNAAKFTETGSISLCVQATRVPQVAEAAAGERLCTTSPTDACAGQTSCIEFVVEDTGVGIADHDQQRIFEPFTQGDQSDTRHHGGAGLGLTICRRLVESMGGALLLSSRPDHGSRFIVRLPSGEPADTTPRSDRAT